VQTRAASYNVTNLSVFCVVRPEVIWRGTTGGVIQSGAAVGGLQLVSCT
jgi:hypothetical protein